MMFLKKGMGCSTLDLRSIPASIPVTYDLYLLPYQVLDKMDSIQSLIGKGWCECEARQAQEGLLFSLFDFSIPVFLGAN